MRVRRIKGQGYTLAEVIVVVIIVAILASIALPIYRRTVIKARDKEAQAMLRLIREAEKIYRLEFYTYYRCDNTDDCNTILRLNLPGEYWDYNVTSATQSTFTAQATPTPPIKRQATWTITESGDPQCSGNDCL